MFVLHGNVFDTVVHQQRTLTLTDFLTDVLLKDSRQTVAVYNLATGVRFTRREAGLASSEDALLASDKPKALAALERLLVGASKAAVILEYAEAIAPAGDPAFQADADRAAVITLQRWSFLPEIDRGDNLVLLVAENLSELSPKVVSNPKVGVGGHPDARPRHAARRRAAGRPAADRPRRGPLRRGHRGSQGGADRVDPRPAACSPRTRRVSARRSSPGSSAGSPDATARAKKLGGLTIGLTKDEIRRLLAPGAPDPGATAADAAERARREADRLIARRKREILERECFGLVEFVEPAHGFDVVGGMEEVKKDLMVIAESIREGRTSRVPMGILFTGPMGTGKTFVAEAFARECGLTTIKLKNFRSKWVGATEGNLEKILTVIKAIGQVVVIIDEGDRAFGNTDGEGDGGTSSRVIARIKEFMSDTSNRGRILFLVMTNRPDKLDVDLKRAGRLDRKIPFLYSQAPEEVEQVARALVRKNRIQTTVDFVTIRDDVLVEARRLQQRRRRSRAPHGERRRRAGVGGRRGRDGRPPRCAPPPTTSRAATRSCCRTWSCWRSSSPRAAACCPRSTPR